MYPRVSPMELIQTSHRRFSRIFPFPIPSVAIFSKYHLKLRKLREITIISELR